MVGVILQTNSISGVTYENLLRLFINLQIAFHQSIGFSLVFCRYEWLKLSIAKLRMISARLIQGGSTRMAELQSRCRCETYKYPQIM